MSKQAVERIILVGYRGAGKTTVAQLTAERLGWPWVDADAFLEKKYLRTIRDIFRQEGESGFRAKETTALGELLGVSVGSCGSQPDVRHGGSLHRPLGGQGLVLATGGGVVLQPENRARLRAAGLVVWLAAEVATLWQRLQADPATDRQRPALSAQGGLAEIRELLTAREPLYRECADLVIDTTRLAPNAVAEQIVSYAVTLSAGS